MLVGRDAERRVIDRLLEGARHDRSGVLALVGEAGIGKTALLGHAAEAAAGMRVLRARGIQSEAEVPFAALSELLRPALGALDRIPAPQARVLSGALALGPATSPDRFATGAATLSLLSLVSEQAPLALLVDDAHLLDAASAEALLFAARRLVDDPIALILTAREGEPSFLDDAHLPVLRIGGLERGDAAALLSTARLERHALDRLYLATGGNPLAMLELASDPDRLGEGPAEGPLLVSARIAAAFARRTADLSDQQRRMLLLAAASDVGDLGVLARAAAELGAAVDDLEPAEAAGLVRLGDGRVEFRHPLVRSGIYADALPTDRRAAHRALAGALPDRDIDRRAWHLAAAAIGTDARASEALEQAGVRARERSAYAVAGRAFERAARLDGSAERRPRLLVAAADSAWLAGDLDRAVVLLDEAAAADLDTHLAAQTDRLRAHVALVRGPVSEGYPLLVSAAVQIAETDPELAAVMLGEAVHSAFFAADTVAMVDAADRAMELAGRHESSRIEFFARMAHGMALICAGDGSTGPAEVRRAVELLEESDELRDDPRLLAWASFGAIWLRESEVGRRLIDGAWARAREEGAVGVLPRLLLYRARDQATTDQWASAESNFEEAARLARETGQAAEAAVALAGLACLQARQGREEACRRHAAEALARCMQLDLGTFVIWSMQALGDLELGLGRPAASVEHHEAQAAELSRRRVDDVDLSPAPELVEAYVRLGQLDEAARAAEAFVSAAEAKGQPWALARATRCRALLAAEDHVETLFDRALELHAQTLDAFETARTRLAYGARLRRMRKRVRARDELRAALDALERLGAPAWAEQARAELAATGETARRRDVTTADDLTPQERQIARLLADGSTTRETAAAVFLSPKTVEYHLRNVYRKLGVRSREQLAEALRAADRVP